MRESITVTTTCALRQSLTKRSVPALNIGELVIGFTRVSYTSSSFSDLQCTRISTSPNHNARSSEKKKTHKVQ